MSLPPSVQMVPKDWDPSEYFPSVIPVSPVAPAASAKVWVDTSTVPPTMRGWNGTAWVAI